MSQTIKELIDNKVPLANLTDKETKISKHYLNLNFNLTDRFQSKALSHIIKENMFADSAVMKVKTLMIR